MRKNPLQKGIAILGSTGSVGTQALQQLLKLTNSYRVDLLSAHRNHVLLIEQVKLFHPRAVVITDRQAFEQVSKALQNQETKVYFGMESLENALENEAIEVVFHAMSGISGLRPLLKSITLGKKILLANKESLVVAGELIMPLAAERKASIIPVDSEHSAIFQCLQDEDQTQVEKYILTASGGPFLHLSEEEIKQVNVAQTLRHPVWQMGKKITVDSAGMMNKGLEVIEAHWLFAAQSDQIEVLIHPQAQVHSLVQFKNRRLKAQVGKADMNSPIAYALHHPHQKVQCQDFSFEAYPELTFQPANRKKFRNLALAYFALEKGGNMPAVLNAANEVAVEAFLNQQWPFYRIPEVVEAMMEKQPFSAQPTLETYFETTQECINQAWEYIKKKQ